MASHGKMADGQRVEAITLALGDKVGFARHGQTLEAVAGDERIPLADGGDYAWVIEQPRFRGMPVSHTSRSSAPPNLRGRGAAIYLGAALAAAAGSTPSTQPHNEPT